MDVAGLACGEYLKLWVGVEVGNDSGRLWLHPKPGDGSCDGLWVDLVKGLLPLEQY